MTKVKAKQIVGLITKGMPGETVVVKKNAADGTIQSQDMRDRDVIIVNGSDRKLKAGSYPRSHFVPTLIVGNPVNESLTYIGG